MKKYSICILASLAALCSCSKEENPQNIDKPAVKVFTATMEGAPDVRATFNDAAKCASWEAGDEISINRYSYVAQSSGTSTTFRDNNGGVYEIRPAYVGSSTAGPENDPSLLVDGAGMSTNWRTPDKSDQEVVVSTPSAIRLKSIKLFNGNYDYSYFCWRGLVVSGSNDQNSWDVLFEKRAYFFRDLGTERNSLAAEVAINATEDYRYYKLEILLDNTYPGNMADMWFVVEGPAPVDSPYEAYFPANIYDRYQEKSFLPSAVTETWKDGIFNMPMYAQSSTTDFQFKNLCGVLKITVKDTELPSVNKIKVSSSNKAMSGDFTVVNDAAVLVSPNVVANTVSVYYTSDVATTAEGTVFYVAVPAQTYRDLKIEVCNSSDILYMRTVSGRDIVVERNKIYTVEFEGEPIPAGTRGTAMRIGDVDDASVPDVEVPWVQLWAGGKKWATYNVLAENDRPEDYGGYFVYGNNTETPGSAYIYLHNGYYEELSGDNDTAIHYWGSNWKMPSSDDVKDLINHCDYEWITVNGVSGARFTGKGIYSCNSIFFPAGGWFQCSPPREYKKRNTEGNYFTTTSYTEQYAHVLHIRPKNVDYLTDDKAIAYNIRAILVE